jgi:hypothetical protein
MSTRSIVERSSGLFFLTSGTNVLAMDGAALGLGAGSHSLPLTAIPAAVGAAGVAVVLAPTALAVAPGRPEGGLVGALVLYGTPVMPATAAVLIYHTIAFWIPSLGGAIAYGLTVARRPERAAAGSPAVHVLERSFRYRNPSWPGHANSIRRKSSTGQCTPSGSGVTTRRRSTTS